MIKYILRTFIFLSFTNAVIGQVPLAYWDFESNTNRNTTVQTAPEIRITSTFANFNRNVSNGSGVTTISTSNSGNGTNYGGSNAGFALSRRGFSTNATSDYTIDNYLTFNGSFDCTGFSTLTISLDAMRADVNAPQNIDIYYSLDDVDYFLADYTSNSVGNSYSTLNFSLPDVADQASTLYLRIIPYNGVTSTGVIRIDNLTLMASRWEDNSNLVFGSTTNHGLGLSSGGTFMPTYGSFYIDINASNYVETTTNVIFNGTLNIVNGNFRVSSPATSIIFHTSDVPIQRTNGTFTITTGASLSFGSSGNTGGAAFAIPNNLFTATSFSSLTINRTNSLTLGNQSFVLSGNLDLTSGTLNDNGNTITIGANITGTGTHSSTSSGALIMTGSGGSISGATLGNLTLNNAGGFSLTSSPTIIGTLSLSDGALAIGSNTLNFNTSSTPITRTSGTITTSTSSNVTFGTQASNFTLPNNLFTSSPSLGNLTINRAGGITIGNQAFTINGTLTLTSGAFDILGTTLSFQTGATPIARTGGTITMSTSSSLSFGANATSFTIPNNTFTSAPSITNLTIDRSGGITVGNQAFTINGTLTLTSGAFDIQNTSLTFQSGNTPIARSSGTLTLGSSANLVFGTSGNTGGNAFIIPDNTFTSAPDFNNFSVNRTNSLTLNNQNFTLRGILTLTSGLLVLPNNHLFTLKSTSITNTALVAQVGGTIQYNTGSAFLVERFIPQLRRAFRDIAPAVNSGTGTFFTNWQESAVNNNGFGTHITGLAGTIGSNDATTGFDMTLSGNRSLSSYNINTGTGAAAWTNYTSTKGSNDTLSAYKGYRLTIRGNRAYDLSVDNTLMNANTILRSTGQLITGTVTYNTSGVTGNATTNTNIRLNFASATGFTMIGNPYVSPIDWVTIAANASNNNVEDTYWVFDPTVGTVGAYVTYNSLSGSSNLSSNVNQYIQPGQAFFIRNNNSVSPTFVIRESDKATSTANLTSVFNTNNTQISSMYFTLEKKINNSFTQMDAAKFCLNDQFNNLKGNEDASKISNETENLSIINFGSQLSIDGRKNISVNDSIRLRVRQTSSSSNYLLKINLSSFNVNGFNYFLRDRFTKTTTPLTMLTNEYAFTTTSDTNSFNDRFTIVFNNASPLPVSFTSIKATNVATGNKIEWKAIQTNASHFQVQHSTNGNNFENIGTISANPLNGSEVSYSFLHTSPISGTNYYRIKSIDLNDKVDISNTVTVNNVKENIKSISIFPNPVSTSNFNIQFRNIEKGNYVISIIDQSGKQVYSNAIYHDGNNQNTRINNLQNLSKGIYTVKISNVNYTSEEKIVLQ